MVRGLASHSVAVQTRTMSWGGVH